MKPPQKDYYARQGERVCCTNGHIICEFGRDVEYGEFFRPKALVKWTQPEPLVGQLIDNIACAQCGAKFVVNLHVFHFTNGWRTKNKKLKEYLDGLTPTVKPRSTPDGRIK